MGYGEVEGGVEVEVEEKNEGEERGGRKICSNGR